MVYKRLKGGTNEATPLVEDYLIRSMLSKIGVSFRGEDLSDFEVQYLTLIGATLNKLEEEDMKKKKRKR